MLLRLSCVAAIFFSSVAVAEEFEPFYARFRVAVAKQDKRAVAASAQFPFRSYELAAKVAKASGSKEPLDPEVSHPDFLKFYGHLFTKEARRHIAKLSPTKRSEFDTDVRSVMIHKYKSGYSWIDFAQDEAGVWRVVGTDNVSE